MCAVLAPLHSSLELNRMVDIGDVVPTVGLYSKILFAYCMIGMYDKA